MKRVFDSKFAMAVLAVTVFGALAVGSIAIASSRATTTVTISAHDALNSDFHGNVKSTRTSCKKNRLVKVFRHRSSGNTLVASDRAELSNGKYRWDTGNSGQPNGRYFAHVSKTRRCKADSSPTVTVNH